MILRAAFAFYSSRGFRCYLTDFASLHSLQLKVSGFIGTILLSVYRRWAKVVLI